MPTSLRHLAHLEAACFGDLPALRRCGDLTFHRRSERGFVAAMHRLDGYFGSIEPRTWSPKRRRAIPPARE